MKSELAEFLEHHPTTSFIRQQLSYLDIRERKQFLIKTRQKLQFNSAKLAPNQGSLSVARIALETESSSPKEPVQLPYIDRGIPFIQVSEFDETDGFKGEIPVTGTDNTSDKLPLLNESKHTKTASPGTMSKEMMNLSRRDSHKNSFAIEPSASNLLQRTPQRRFSLFLLTPTQNVIKTRRFRKLVRKVMNLIHFFKTLAGYLNFPLEYLSDLLK